MIELIDDGTLDTVLRCSECGEELRYNYDGGDISPDESAPSYDSFIEWAIQDATDTHECCMDCHYCDRPLLDTSYAPYCGPECAASAERESEEDQ